MLLRKPLALPAAFNQPNQPIGSIFLTNQSNRLICTTGQTNELDRPAKTSAVLEEALEALVEGTGDDLILLILGEVVEVHGVAGNAHRKLRVLLGVSLGVEQRVAVEHVDVQVVATLLGVRVDHAHEVIGLSLGDVSNLHGALLFIHWRRSVVVGIVTEIISA